MNKYEKLFIILTLALHKYKCLSIFYYKNFYSSFLNDFLNFRFRKDRKVNEYNQNTTTNNKNVYSLLMSKLIFLTLIEN
jgi:predicted GNAT superfamily acetyltransferase